MIFNKIAFKNYRCFINGELNFHQSSDKNINLILGNNGAGKTETLFAFWWVLYGFDFSKLKNKEASPYALNSKLYKQIESGEIEYAECTVSLEFIHENVTYLIERTEEYKKTPQRIGRTTYATLSYYKQNFELSIPLRNENEIEKRLNQIIPKQILNGIVFDGERMKQLSAVDDTSVKAIRGVISDVTNVELIEQIALVFRDIKQKTRKKISSIATSASNSDLTTLNEQIVSNEKLISSLGSDKLDAENQLQDFLEEIEQLHLLLVDIKEIKELEQERKREEIELENLKKLKTESIKSFSEGINRGYLLIADSIFSDVSDTIENYDVPEGLTVEAVESILCRDNCICGEAWDQTKKEKLKQLLTTLPPENINSTLSETVRQNLIRVKEIEKEISNDYKELNSINEKINTCRNNIASIKTRISTFPNQNIKELEQRNENAKKMIWKLEEKIKEADERLPQLKAKQNGLLNELKELGEKEVEIGKLNREISFIEKSMQAMVKIKELNSMKALKRINELLNLSYELMSDDINLGRRLHIVQFNSDKKYQLLTYYIGTLEVMLNKFKENGEYSRLINEGKSEEEIIELAIINSAESNSTGQSKMNTFAFVKAILEYSKESKFEDLFGYRKEYPLLIDAPFGDIFDKNREKSASALPGFTHQIILMLAKESYDLVSEFISQKVSTVHEFTKVNNEPLTIISQRKLEEVI